MQVKMQASPNASGTAGAAVEPPCRPGAAPRGGLLKGCAGRSRMAWEGYDGPGQSIIAQSTGEDMRA